MARQGLIKSYPTEVGCYYRGAEFWYYYEFPYSFSNMEDVFKKYPTYSSVFCIGRDKTWWQKLLSCIKEKLWKG